MGDSGVATDRQVASFSKTAGVVAQAAASSPREVPMAPQRPQQEDSPELTGRAGTAAKMTDLSEAGRQRQASRQVTGQSQRRRNSLCPMSEFRETAFNGRGREKD